MHRRGRLRCGTGRQHRAGAGESHAPRSRHCPDRLFGRHGGSRVEFCRRLKARVATSRIPVLGLIGAGDRLNARAAVVAGCTVLAKPCSPERLLVEIVRVLGVWPRAPPCRRLHHGRPTDADARASAARECAAHGAKQQLVGCGATLGDVVTSARSSARTRRRSMAATAIGRCARRDRTLPGGMRRSSHRRGRPDGADRPLQ